MSLEREWATYQRCLPELLARYGEGQWVLIHGNEVVAVFGTQDEAMRLGYACWLWEPFMVHPIRAVEPVRYCSRGLKPHRA
jgi:hypothetical protein